MAPGQGQQRRHRGLVDTLAQPRYLTHVLLVGAGLAAGQLIYQWLDVRLIAYISALAGPLCMVSASAVWSMRDKADGALDGEHLDAQTYIRYRAMAARLRRRSMALAAWVTAAALLAWSPMAAVQTVGAVWQWMTLAGGAAVGEAAYGYLLAAAWERELRAHREREAYRRKSQAEREALLEKLAAGAPPGGFPWRASGEPLAPPSTH